MGVNRLSPTPRPVLWVDHISNGTSLVKFFRSPMSVVGVCRSTTLHPSSLPKIHVSSTSAVGVCGSTTTLHPSFLPKICGSPTSAVGDRGSTKESWLLYFSTADRLGPR
ncbi:hypothetical protein DY000_02060954 [Brassica cretica]|uniref:Uncharacterized protein n=1 Tax=Brassica cretica TaxID=69181 RepID=A0ABQ7AZ56_BRACR|nr:hypothetical protein DY000_02060954 [Brassica cretica]